MVKERCVSLDVVFAAAVHPIRCPMIERLSEGDGSSATLSWIVRYRLPREDTVAALANKVGETEMKEHA